MPATKTAPCARCGSTWAPVFHGDESCPLFDDRREDENAMAEKASRLPLETPTPEPLTALTQVEAVEHVKAIKAKASAPVQGGLEGMLVEALRPQLAQLIDWNDVDQRITKIAQREARNVAPVTVEVRTPVATTNLGVQHAQFPRLVEMISQRTWVWLIGEAGSGKTSAAETAAKALGLSYTAESVGPTTAKYDLIGYPNAAGVFVPGALYEPFKNGGVILIDEIDSASADALVAINQVLANSVAAFGREMVTRHPDFICIAAANTYGTGRDSMYVGRSQLDAATLDRFEFLRWDCDAKIERSIVDSYVTAAPDRQLLIEAWYRYVLDVRQAINSTKVQQLATTRAIISGCKLIAGAGWTLAATADARFWARMGDDDEKKIKSAMKGN